MSHLRRRWTALLTAGALAMLALTTVGGGTSVAAACPATWTMQTADNPGTTSTVFQDVDSSSSTDAWAVGSYLSGGALRTLAEHYDGSAWTKFKTPNVTGSDNVLNDVVDLSPTDAWAVGWENAYYTLVEHWNGTSWSVVTSPSPGTQWSYLTAVDASNSTDVWAVGWQQSSPGLHTTLALHYQGSTWDVVPTPNTADPSDNLSAVAAIAPNDVWAGGYTSATTGAQTLLMHWDGTAWTIVPSPNLVGGNNTITDLAAVSATDVWAVGYAVSGNKTFGLTLHWDGTTWSMVSTPAPQSLTMLRGVAAVSSTNVWAVGLTYDPTLGDYNSLTENWNGTQWTVVPAASATGENYLTGATAAPSTGDLWAVGWDPVKKMPLNSLVEARCGTPAAAARLPA